MLRSKGNLNWLLLVTFCWHGLKFTVTTTSTESLSFLNRVNFLKGISNNLEPLGFQKIYGLWGYLLKAKVLAPMNARTLPERILS